jgi:RimJ/RimL family protein N-acetyltransferase
MAQQVLPQRFYTHISTFTCKASPSATLGSSNLPLTLRILLPDNVPILAKLLSNPANTQDDLSVYRKSQAELEDMISEWLIFSEPLQRINFLVLASDVPIGISGLGWVGFHKDDDESAGRAGAAGVMLDPEARGKGYAYEAMRMSIDYGLRELGLVEVRIGTTSSNVAMRGLMEKKFGMLAEVREPDRFGNDLMWRIGRDQWMGKDHV